MQDRLERLIHLINKTGDKLVVFDRFRPDDSFVITTLDDYEQLVQESVGVKGLTEDELIDKINQDIALWKSEQSGISGLPDFKGNFEETEADSLPAVSPSWQPPKADGEAGAATRKNAWNIPEARKREAPLS